MNVLPHLNPVGGGHDDGEGTRLWKRVRRLETDLGYSNLALEVLPNRRMLGATRAFWLTTDKNDSPSRHRKRRLPGVYSSARIDVSAPQRELGNRGRIPVLEPPSEQQSMPWTQPVGQLSVARGNPPRLMVPPKDYIAGPADTKLQGKTISTRPLTKVYGDDKPPPYLDGVSCLPPSGTKKAELGGLAISGSPHPAKESKTVGLSVAGLAHPHQSSGCPAVEFKAATAPDFGNDAAPKSGPGAPQRELSTTKPTARSNVQDVPLNVETRAAQSSKCVREGPGSLESRATAVENPPSRQKLRAVRGGSCRSLLSPQNPLISNTVVARVKQGLQNGGEKRPKVLLVGSGTFNPVHKLHIRRFYLARTFLEGDKGMRVVGGIVSPSHPTLVRQRHRVRAAEIIPPKHRLSMARAAVGEGSWLVVDPWEVTRRRIMDYMSVLEHAKEVCHETFPGFAGDITILYMCQASQIHHLNPAMLRAGGFGVITVCRPLEKERLLKELSPSFRNIAIVVEDSAILSAELEKTSSTMVRHLLKQGKSAEGMVGKAVARYIRDNNIANRVSGKQKWTVEDNAFMFEQEDKEDRPYHNLPRMYVRRASQMPLHY